MAGLPTLLVELDDAAGSGAFPYDITAYVDMRAGWNLDRGRQNEFDEIDASIARLTLNNRDGRFTLGSAAYGIVVDQRLRITETVGVTTSRRVTGYVQDWPVTFADAGARNVPCQVTVSDRQARMTRAGASPLWEAQAVTYGARLLYTLGEAAGSTSAGDTAGTSDPALQVAGSVGTTVVFGSDGPFERSSATFGGRYLAASKTLLAPAARTFEAAVFLPSTVVTVAPGTAYLCAFGDDLPGGEAFGLALQDFKALGPAGTPYNTGLNSVPVGQWVHLALTYLQTSSTDGIYRMYIDGAMVKSQVVVDTDRGQFASGLLAVGRNLAGSMCNVAVYESRLTDSQVATLAALSTAGATGDSSDGRIARIASYVGMGPGELSLEAGVLQTVPSQSLADTKVFTAWQDVATAEGGAVFFDGSDRLVLHNRYHRLRSATQAPAVALVSEDVNHDDLAITVDKQFLQNTITGTRRDGATQKVVNDASVTKYGEYPASLDLLVATDAEALDRIAWQVGRYAEPRPRLSSVTVDLLTQPDAAKVRALLLVELGDRITIAGLPSQSPISAPDLIVEGISESQSIDTWQLTFNTTAADLVRAWVLGNATYGRLGSTTRLHF